MAVSATSTEAGDAPVTSGFWGLMLGSIGVVFGDIGTSPLYAFREAVAGAAQGQPVTRIMVLGVGLAGAILTTVLHRGGEGALFRAIQVGFAVTAALSATAGVASAAIGGGRT